MSEHDKDTAAIREACKRGLKRTWSPTADVRVTRRTNGRVKVEFPDQNHAVYNSLYAYVCVMVADGKAKEFQEGTRNERWSFSFMPVR